MKNHNYLIQLLLISAIVAFGSCSGKQGKDKIETSENPENVQQSTALCMYDYNVNGMQVLEDYSNPKSHLTYIKLGEVAVHLGETATDSVNKREYCKIELSDGTIGWTMSKYIILNATPAAVILSTPVYERPDILTKSAKKMYESIDILAITEERDNWCNVSGRNNLNSGWVLKENLSTSKEDFAMAILARREIFDSKGNVINAKLNDFVNNAQYPGSQIVTILRDILIKNVESAAMSEPVEIESNPEDLPD